jgi:hypothetical protein
MKENHKIIIRRNCGFFSDFLTSLAGIMYCHNNNHNVHVDWKSDLYLTQSDNNLFDLFFKNQINSDLEFNQEYINVTPYGFYYPEIVGKNTEKDIYDFLLPSNALIKELDILNSDFINNIRKDIFNGKKVLGVHKRGTDHYQHGQNRTNAEVMEFINNEYKNNNYDNVFLITDDLTSFDFFKQQLGETLIHTSATKVNGNNGVHTSNYVDRYKIAEEVVTDAILLSLTDFKLLTKSNVSTFSNICNLKQDTFTYMDKFINYI